MSERIIQIDYTNWRGVRRKRLVRPTGFMTFDSTEWHPEKQWLMEAIDVQSGGVIKLFALKDIHGTENGHGLDHQEKIGDAPAPAGGDSAGAEEGEDRTAG